MKNFIKNYKILFIFLLLLISLFLFILYLVASFKEEDQLTQNNKAIKNSISEDVNQGNVSGIVSRKEPWERWSQELNNFNTMTSHVNSETGQKIKRAYENIGEAGWEKVYDRFDHEEEVYEMAGKTIFSVTEGNYRVDIISGPDGLERNKTQDQGWGYTVKTFKNDKLIDSYSTVDWIAAYIYKFKVKETIYYLVDGWSGGGSCCNSMQLISYKNDGFKISQLINAIRDEVEQDRFFIKDSELYLFLFDDRFGYFEGTCGSCSYPMQFPVFYRIDKKTGKLVIANNEFKEFYQDTADRIDIYIKELKEGLEGDELCQEDISSFYMDVFPPLVARIVNYLLAGDTKSAWDKFIEDYNYKYFRGKEIEDIETVKQKIIEIMGELIR